MIFSDSDVKRPVRELANKFGVEFENVVSYHFMLKPMVRDTNSRTSAKTALM